MSFECTTLFSARNVSYQRMCIKVLPISHDIVHGGNQTFSRGEEVIVVGVEY